MKWKNMGLKPNSFYESNPGPSPCVVKLIIELARLAEMKPDDLYSTPVLLCKIGVQYLVLILVLLLSEYIYYLDDRQ